MQVDFNKSEIKMVRKALLSKLYELRNTVRHSKYWTEVHIKHCKGALAKIRESEEMQVDLK